MCWTALDRLLGLAGRGQLRQAPIAEWQRHAERIRRTIETRGWNRRHRTYAGEFGRSGVDASLLLLPLYGFAPADSPRMRRTYEAIQEWLGVDGGLFYRNTRIHEGAFAACSLWAVQYLAQGGGPFEEARALFEAFLQHANDLSLFAEEVDPATGEALGNYPLAFTHVGIINAARALDRRAAQDRRAPEEVRAGYNEVPQ
jgi:GH15 family glucan-1,4-alpha-glucosidase